MAECGVARKQPFQWWCWDDYENDPALKLCSFAAQGVWMRMLRVCWHAPSCGYFLDQAGAPPSLGDLAALWAKPSETIQAAMAELEARGVFSRDPSGVIYSRRMVSDAAKRKAKKAQADAETQASPTERELADLAVREHLEAASRDEERRAKQRARQARYRAAKRAQQQAESAVAKMRAFEAMACANARAAAGSDGEKATLKSVTGDVAEGVTVTSPASPVTSPIASKTSNLSPCGSILSSIFHLPEDSQPDAARSLRHPSGGERAAGEAESKPQQMRARIAAALPLVQAPNESEEAFAARRAARQGRAA